MCSLVHVALLGTGSYSFVYALVVEYVGLVVVPQVSVMSTKSSVASKQKFQSKQTRSLEIKRLTCWKEVYLGPPRDARHCVLPPLIRLKYMIL